MLLYRIIMSILLARGVMLEVSLFPEDKAEVVSGHNLNFTCTYMMSTVSHMSWRNDDGPQGTVRISNNCSADGNVADRTLYHIKCQTNEVLVTLLNVQRDQHGKQYQCYVFGSDSKQSSYSEVFVIIPVLNISIPSLEGDTCTLKENHQKTFECDVSPSRRIPSVKWYRKNVTTDGIVVDKHKISNSTTSVISQEPQAHSSVLGKTTGKLVYTGNRNESGLKIYCEAENKGGSMESNSVTLNITYKGGLPEIEGFTNNSLFKAIYNQSQELTCSVHIGNPAATLSWECYHGTTTPVQNKTTVQMKVMWTPMDNDTCICISRHFNGNDFTQIFVMILSGPTAPVFYLNSSIELKSTKVRLFKYWPALITCTSSASPQPILYKWVYQNNTLVSSCNITQSDMQHSGIYRCFVNNTMEPSKGNIQQGYHEGFLEITLLFPPTVHAIPMQEVVEGDTLRVGCNITQGEPSITDFLWERTLKSSEMEKWHIIPDASSNDFVLEKSDINRSDAGTYRCTASNDMNPTEGTNMKGSDFKTFLLDVLYKASILRFVEHNNRDRENITLAENAFLMLLCDVDSNPESSMSINREAMHLNSSYGKHITYMEMNASCESAGKYQCEASNLYNNDAVKRILQINILCKPRLSTIVRFNKTITSALNTEARLTIVVQAYPIPGEKNTFWFKKNGSVEESLNGNPAVLTQTVGLNSSLFIRNVVQSDFGEYIVRINNSEGTFEQHLFLNPEDVPSNPTDFVVLEEHLHQIKVQWKPNFNGGLHQQFMLSYRKKNENGFTQVTIDDTYGTVMTYTLTELTVGTNYEISLFAKNMKGNSTEVLNLDAKTLEEQIFEENDVVPIIGATLGSIGLAGIVIVSFVLIRKYRNVSRGKKRNQKNESSQERITGVGDTSEDEVMTENPMYGSGPTKQPNDVVYSLPIKESVNTGMKDVYAVVSKKQKPNKKKPQQQKKNTSADVYENRPTFQTMNNVAFEENPYENPETTAKQNISKKTNRDGLVYADLAFNSPAKGQKKLVIHGLDNITTYVEVDFTKKADPLPESDTEENEK